jgi:hypothetical protein
MELNHLFTTNTGCSGSHCPTVYETDRGTLAVQGWDLPAGTIETPDGESIVEIPADVEEHIARRWASRQGLI